jgi:RNA polymerase sigma-70 factor (ECF subfamily)
MSDLIHYPPVRPEARGVVDGRFRRRASDGDEGAERRTLARMVERAQDGDREALAYLYLRYSGNVYGFVASIVHDEYEAEDVTQQVFTKLMGALSKYQPREVPFLAWMMTFSRNVAIDHLRRLRSIPCEDVRDADATDRATDPIDSVCVRDALRSLPAEQREVVLLRHVVGLTPCEIAGRMGRTESSVHGLHHRGRGTMRATLRQVGAAPAVVAS